MKTKNVLMLITIFTCILCVNSIFGQGDVIYEDYKIVANDGAMGDEFGHSIAIDNDIIAVGVPSDDDNGINSGAAYLYDASTGAQIVKLLPTDGAAGAEFGFSIAISNGIVVVGARVDDENGVAAGAAYLFDATDGTQLAKLTPNDPEPGDEFGNSIAIDNGIVAVGAWRADEYGVGSGAAYLFDASTGNQLDKLLPDTGNNYQTFGVSIAMDNGLVAIGARTYFVLGQGYTFAKAYLFDVSTGNQINVFQPDIPNYNGDQGGNFADCLDIENGLLAVGAPYRSVVWDFSGAAYIFDVSTGDQLHFITPSDLWDQDRFGTSISIDNGVVAIGAQWDDDNGFDSGSAYIFDAITGVEVSKLLASDGAEFDLFGTSVAINGDVTVVGAKGYTGDHSGSAYVYSGITVGISDNELDGISLYPNPGSGKVTIGNLDKISDINEIRISNSLGQLVEVINNTSFDGSTKLLLDISKYEHGLYFLNIRISDRSIVKKLLIE